MATKAMQKRIGDDRNSKGSHENLSKYGETKTGKERGGTGNKESAGRGNRLVNLQLPPVTSSSSVDSMGSTTNESLTSGERDPFTKNEVPKSNNDHVDDLWGFYELEDDNGNIFDNGTYTSVAHEEREAWSEYTSKLLGTKIPSNREPSVGDDDVEVLYSYNNRCPSQCFKLSSETLSAAMELSCFISGFRISQRISTGEIAAQFRFVYCYGSRTHIGFRSFSEFRELASILKYANEHMSSKLFPKALKVWNYIEYKKKHYRDLSIKSLVERSVYLNKFMESVLFESPNCSLLLYFAQSKRFAV
jgi:hypothetical protein